MPFELTFEFLGNYCESERATLNFTLCHRHRHSSWVDCNDTTCIQRNSVMWSETSNPTLSYSRKKHIALKDIAEQREMAIVSICWNLPRRTEFIPKNSRPADRAARGIWQFAAIRFSILNALISRKDEGKKGRPVRAGARQRARGCVNRGWKWIYPRLSDE